MGIVGKVVLVGKFGLGVLGGFGCVVSKVILIFVIVFIVYDVYEGFMNIDK